MNLSSDQRTPHFNGLCRIFSRLCLINFNDNRYINLLNLTAFRPATESETESLLAELNTNNNYYSLKQSDEFCRISADPTTGLYTIKPEKSINPYETIDHQLCTNCGDYLEKSDFRLTSLFNASDSTPTNSKLISCFRCKSCNYVFIPKTKTILH